MEALKLVSKPAILLIYERKDITVDISPFILSATYSDHLHGQADEIEIVLQDREHRWRGPWYPSKADTLTLELGYAGSPLLPCGEFEIDEIEVSGGPDTCTIRGLGPGIKAALRTKNSKAYENLSLRQIADQVAKSSGLVLQGNIEDIRHERITQSKEHDLAFLKRLANQYGYAFTVRGKKLVFTKKTTLDQAAPVLTLSPADFAPGYSFRDKTQQIYRSASVAYQDPKTKRLHTYTSQATGVAKGDSLRINQRTENPDQARAKADSALYQANKSQGTGSFTCAGNTRLNAGGNIRLTGLGVFSGTYQVNDARHVVDRSGYKSSVEVQRVA